MMRAAVLTAVRTVEVQEVPIPTIDDDGVLVRVTANALCGSDIHSFEGRHARVKPGGWFGHEPAGIIEAIGPLVDTVVPGQRVAVDSVLPCHACEFCRAGHTNRCVAYMTIGSRGDGGLAEYLAVPARNVYPIPEPFSLDTAALIQPLAIAHHAVHSRAAVSPGSTVAVVGAGPIGLCILALCRAMGIETTVSDVRRARLDMAAELGASKVLDASAPLDAEDVKADITFDCVGGESPTILEACCAMTRPGGMVVVLGTYSSPAIPIPTAAFNNRELIVVSSRSYTSSSYAACVGAAVSDEIEMPPMITHVFPLEGTQEALTRISEGDPSIVKAVIHPGD